MKLFLPFVLAILLSMQPAYPWGGDGHWAIADAAKGMLNPQAKASVEKILGNDDLASVSTWLDDVRNAKKHHVGPLKADAEAKDFNAKFPTNELWHYVDLPVGGALYSEASSFASKDDVVHALHHSIDVLEGRADDMTAAQALCVLVHLVGDVHQPLHTVAGYFDVTNEANPKLITDAKAAVGKPQDRGGNQLFYTKTLELHALWDTKMPQKVQRERHSETLAQILASDSGADKWRTAGDYHAWPEKWASETAVEAVAVYQGIYFGQVTLAPGGALDRIEVTLPDDYEKNQIPRAITQLAKASAHLAQLLNSIKFNPVAAAIAPAPAPLKAATPAPAQPPTAVVAPAAAPPAGGYFASKKSAVFHKPDCKSVATISAANLVNYASREEAIAAGKKPCSICKP